MSLCLHRLSLSLDFSSDDLEEEEASVVLTPAEILAQLNSFRSKIFNDYLNGQVCDKSEFESLHQYIFFHSALRNTDKIPVRLSQAVNDIIRYFQTFPPETPTSC